MTALMDRRLAAEQAGEYLPAALGGKDRRRCCFLEVGA